MQELIKETLTKSVEMHVAGEFDLASQLYASVLKLQPDHADANHNMGLLKLDMGNDLEALPYLQTALQADTRIAQFWLSYIKALVNLERLDEAGRILDLASRGVAKLDQCNMVVLDEVDKLLSENFKMLVGKILDIMPTSKQISLFSATYPVMIRPF